jgi:hypothetical protein
VFTIAETQTPDFSFEGIDPLATIAGLSLSIETELVRRSSTVVRLLHRPVSSVMPPPCTRLSNGTGVWVVRLNDATGRVQYYCPFPQPRFYGQF